MNFRQVHLDFHTSELIPGVGAKFDKKRFQEALIAGHVNSITLFSKCHHGWSYHPTEVGEQHPSLSFDLLGAQIEAAREIGVKTPIYISGGFDEKLARRHPEWLKRFPDERIRGAKDFAGAGYHHLCMNSPYLDYLLNQLREVLHRYDARDGIFIDIVGISPCYCQNCVRELLAQGIDPYTDTDAVLRQGERVYANYVRRVREVIDEVDPSIHVFHNGGHIGRGMRRETFYNSHLELESLPTGGWGYDHFPLSARYVQQLGMEVLGMTGKFHRSWGEFGGFKHPNALRYEAALSVANGAKCSVGDQLHPSGEMDMATYRLIGEAYAEVEQKEPWLDHVTATADIGLLSAEALVNSCTETPVLQNKNQPDAGAVRILLEGHYLFNVLDTENDFSPYKVIILPDVPEISSACLDKLRAFVAAGGKLLVTGHAGIDAEKKEFLFDLGVRYEGESDYAPEYFCPAFEADGVGMSDHVMYSRGIRTALSGGTELGARHVPYFNRSVLHFCSHAHAPSSGVYDGAGMALGRDGVYIGWDIFSEYAERGALIDKRMVQHALDLLLAGRDTVKTSLPAQGVVTLQEQKDEHRYVLHLLYASPVCRGKDTQIIEDIVPVYNVEAALQLPHPAKGAYLAPQGEPITLTERDGVQTLTLPRLECHQMIVLDY